MLFTRFVRKEQTRGDGAEVKNEGSCWCGGTQWYGRADALLGPVRSRISRLASG